MEEVFSEMQSIPPAKPPTALRRFLRERLSEQNYHDIVNDYGERRDISDNYSEGIGGNGLDSRISKFVTYVQLRQDLQLLVHIVGEWRPDLKAGLVEIGFSTDPSTPVLPYKRSNPDVTRQKQLDELAQVQPIRATSGSLELSDVQQLRGHSAPVRSLKWSPDGSLLASGDTAGNIFLWQGDGTVLRTIAGLETEVRSIAWSPDGSRLTHGLHDDSAIRLWKVTGEQITQFKSGGRFQPNAAIWSPDMRLLASGATEGLRFWRGDGALIQTLPPAGNIQSLSWSPNGQLLAGGYAGGKVQIWLNDGTLFKTRTSLTRTTTSVAWSSNDKDLAFASDATAYIWNIENDQVQQLEGHWSLIHTVAWSPDGKYLASGGFDKTIRFWNTDGTQVLSLEIPTGNVYNVVWSPNGTVFCAATDSEEVLLWKVTSK